MGGYSDIFITEQSLSAIVIILLIIALAFAIPAFFIRWSKKRLFEIENDFLLFGILCYLVYMIDWLVMFPPMYRVNLIALGQLKIYASFKHDLNLYLRLIFISTLLSWSILWSIKLSLLLLYKRLMRGLPAQLRWWWVVFVFTIATYVFSIVTTFTSCGGPVLMLKDPAGMFCYCSHNFTTSIAHAAYDPSVLQTTRR